MFLYIYNVQRTLRGGLFFLNSLAFCIETSTLYKYVTDGTSPIDYGTPDDKYVTITGNGSQTRWVGESGLYCYDQKANTFISNKLIVGPDATVTPMSGDLVLDSTVGGFLMLNVTGGASHNLTLPTAANSVQGQCLSILVVGTSSYSAILQTANSNLNHECVFTPGTWASFEFGENLWHLAGGKNAITQLDQKGIPTYKTTQEWNNIVQSAGVITGGVCTDVGGGGIAISALTAICKTTDSDIAGNVFINVDGGSISAGSPPTGLADGTNYVYLDYNGRLPVYRVTADRSSLNRTTQFILANVFKDGDGLEIVNLESTISNLSRKVVNRLIEVNGVNRVSGALVSEVDTRCLQTTSGVMYYGLERIITPARNTFTTDTFDVFFRNGTGGWHEIEGFKVVDNLRWDNDSSPVAVGGGVAGTSSYSGGVIKVTTNSAHGLVTGAYVTIAGINGGTNEANGNWEITYVSSTEFTLNNSVYVNPWVSGGTVNDLPMGTITVSGGTHYGVQWVFICTEGDLYVLYGQADYASSSAAESATLPTTLPSYLLFNTVLAAKVIVRPADAHFTEIISAYTVSLGTSIATVHNSLGGLQGGTSSEYYHLTSAEHSAIVGAGNVTTGGVNSIGLYSISPTGKTISSSVLDTTLTYPISMNIVPHTLGGGRVYTVPNAGTNADFVMTESAQTINGVKYMTSGIKTPFVFPNVDSNAAWQVMKADGSTPVVTVDTSSLVLSVHGIGSTTIASPANTCINSYDTVNDYLQCNIQNLSAGNSATTDWIATANNGTDSTNYIDMGINSSTFNGGTFFPGGWTINGPDSGYLFTSDGELAIGTANNAVPQAIRFFSQNPLLANQKGMITGTGRWSNGAHTPTAWMHLKASGATTVNTAPLKFTSGSLLSSPEDGAMEYNGSVLDFTIGATRANFVFSEGTQTINGTKTFSTAITGSVSGSSGSCTGNSATASKSTNLIGGNNTTLLGSMPYQSNTDATTLLGPNTTAVKQFLSQTGTGTGGAAPVWSGVSISDVGGILATGATTGATSQAQTFTTGVKTSNVFPATDSTTAFQVRKANGSTSVVNVDTSNSRVFIGGATAPTAGLHLAAATGGATTGSAPLKFTTGTLLTTAEAGAIEYDGNYYQTISNATRVATGGVLHVNTTGATGASSTAEQILATYTLPANTLDTNNEYIEIDAVFSVTGANTSTLRLRLGGLTGGLVYASNASTMTGTTARILAKVYRTGATTQTAVAYAGDTSNLVTVRAYYSATVGQTLANALAVVATSQNSNDGTRITLRTFEVKYSGAPVA